MVGYLNAPGNIFYHGPKGSGAANLLCDFNAAVLCDILEISSICESLSKILSSNIFLNIAKRLAIERCSLKNIQSFF